MTIQTLNFKKKTRNIDAQGYTSKTPKRWLYVLIMSEHKFFINRRKGNDRRLDFDPCEGLPIDLYHRKRRKSSDRRAPRRSIEQDYFAYLGDATITKH